MWLNYANLYYIRKVLRIDVSTLRENLYIHFLICLLTGIYAEIFVGKSFKILLKIEFIYDNRNIDYNIEFLLKYKSFYSLFKAIKFTFFIYSWISAVGELFWLNFGYTMAFYNRRSNNYNYLVRIFLTSFGNLFLSLNWAYNKIF